MRVTAATPRSTAVYRRARLKRYWTEAAQALMAQQQVQADPVED
eukprot:CAMPEP_0185910718 /NCGR_PEP_ID=MMETSP0196C-20130402/21275_1 /TAXON_ID=2932 /ORGANISM="Alexandrium fundyense, Strain CCMP1719" /LENGTH=43 /DNA_ID= /DNA_START= /DNA_END= /DNA_ORIENTATION=